MILDRLILNNFRQFKGEQTIEFANSTGKNSKNVTVILGENGRGKTSIFRAVMFALFGERRIRQDENISQEELHLVNSSALDNAKKEDRPVAAYVSLTFYQGDFKYEIIRELLGYFSNEKRLEEVGKVKLHLTRPDGNTITKTDPLDIDTIINSVMDRKICEYFLFDGEKIQRLTLASIEQRREISKGIRNLLNIDSLEKSIKAIELLKKKLDKELLQKSSGEYKQVLNRMTQIEEEKKLLSEENKTKEHEYELASAQKKKIDQQLEAYTEIKDLLKQREELEHNLEELTARLKSISLEIKNKNGKAPFLLLCDMVNEVYSAIEQKRKKGESHQRSGRILLKRSWRIKLAYADGRSYLEPRPLLKSSNGKIRPLTQPWKTLR